MKKILFHHGWTNRRPKGHWMRLAAAELRAAGNQVWYPQFPNPERPKPQEWQELISQEAAMMDELSGGEKIAITHSLGCMNWMLAAMTNQFSEPFDRVLMVAPPDPIMTEQADGIEGEPMDIHHPELLPAIKRYAKSLTIVSSENDRWLPRGIQVYEQALQQQAVIVEGAGHFSIDDGWGKWRGLVEWAQKADPSALKTR